MQSRNNREHILKTEDLIIGYGNPQKESFRYGPVNTMVNKGDMTAVIGRNGIGKSSLLRVLSALRHPLSGRILLYDKEIAEYSRQQLSRMISFVSTENTGLNNITVRETVAMGRYPYTGWLGIPGAEDGKAICYAMVQTGTDHIADKYVWQLSDGERQKTMIARALAQDTPLIILDEPTAFLDIPSKHDILEMLGNLAHSGKTIIFSIHDLDTALRMSDRIWLMTESGVYEGAPEDLLINELFSKLFINSSYFYDTKSDGFRLKKDLKNNIGIKGRKELVFFTAKAVERAGFKWSRKETGMRIQITEGAPLFNGDNKGSGSPGSGAIKWHFSSDDINNDFNDIYSLIRFLKGFGKV
jgi:iron complex transport system ATP-binding protein